MYTKILKIQLLVFISLVILPNIIRTLWWMSTKEGELSKNSLFSNNRIEMMSGCSSPPLDKNSYHPSKYPSAAVTPSKGSVSILDHVLMMHNLQLEETQLQLPNIKNNSEEIRRKEKTNGKRYVYFLINLEKIGLIMDITIQDTLNCILIS